jgi:hypothetical protein
LQTLGNGIGEFVALTVFMGIQINMSVLTGTWTVGFIILVMGVIVVGMIREPVLKGTRKSFKQPLLSEGETA